MFTIAPILAEADITMDKLLTILSSSLRSVLGKWVSYNIGLELFAINGIHEIVLSQCGTYWEGWFQPQLDFYSRLAREDVPARNFDTTLQNTLVASNQGILAM